MPIITGYVRCSTGQQAESGLGMAAQSRAITAYCASHALAPIEIYTDVAVSGGVALGLRSAGRRLLERLATAREAHVVLPRLDRAFRSVLDALSTLQQWETAGVRVHLLDLGIVTGGGETGLRAWQSRFFLQLLAAFAELERIMASERTLAAAAARKARGLSWGGRQPYGWAAQANGRLEPDPAQQQQIQRMAQLRQQGCSYLEIARQLAQLAQFNTAGRPWDPRSIQRILCRSNTVPSQKSAE